MAERSSGAYTATDRMPASAQARAILTAISPRFAIKRLENTFPR
jgi:hypothetical protein